MPRFLLKLSSKIVEWSTIVDAPITQPMTREELQEYIREQYGEEGLRRLPSRLVDMDLYGASSGETPREAVTCNRAGEGETEMSYVQLCAWADAGGGPMPVGEVVRKYDDEGNEI